MNRRAFLGRLGALGALAAGIGCAASRRDPAERTEASPPPDDRRELLAALADVVVPRYGSSPSASEAGVVSLLVERASTESRSTIYELFWPALEEHVRDRVEFVEGLPDARSLARACESLHREFRAGSRSPAAALFEQIRRDVLRLYYTTPAGWGFVGYGGPGHPPGRS